MEFWQSVAFLETHQLTEVARVAELVGFTGTLTGDHIVQPQELSSAYPGTDDGVPIFAPDTEWPDTWCVISAMAAVTHHLRFAPCIYIAPARDLITVAKLFSTASVLSGGRTVFGIGVGWMREEFEAMGQDFATRGKRMDEMLPVLHRLWAGGWVEHHGEFYDFAPLQISPVPRGPVTVWCGGNTAPGIRRAVTTCDGWINGRAMDPDDAIAAVRQVRAAREAAGLPVDGFDILTGISTPIDAPLCRKLEDAGVTGIIAAPWMYASSGLAHGDYRSSLSAKIAAMELFAESVITKV
jgi:probable F420-dependent oxidoreductase